jgi:hypothetical protein
MRIGRLKLIVLLLPMMTGCLRHTRVSQQPEFSAPVPSLNVLQLVETINRRYDQISSLTATLKVAVAVPSASTMSATSKKPHSPIGSSPPASGSSASTPSPPTCRRRSPFYCLCSSATAGPTGPSVPAPPCIPASASSLPWESSSLPASSSPTFCSRCSSPLLAASLYCFLRALERPQIAVILSGAKSQDPEQPAITKAVRTLSTRGPRLGARFLPLYLRDMSGMSKLYP